MKTIKTLKRTTNNRVVKLRLDEYGYYSVTTLINTDQVVGVVKEYKSEVRAMRYANNFLNA